MAMSFVQGGSGFPFFSKCVFRYLCGVPLHDIDVELCEVPDFEVKFILEQVCIVLYKNIILLYINFITVCRLEIQKQMRNSEKYALRKSVYSLFWTRATLDLWVIAGLVTNILSCLSLPNIMLCWGTRPRLISYKQGLGWERQCLSILSLWSHYLCIPRRRLYLLVCECFFLSQLNNCWS